MLSQIRALSLLSECTGEEIWPIDYCRARGVPEPWIDQLADAFESSFDRDRDTIYYAERATNQFHGVPDLELAKRLGGVLGVDVERVTSTALSRSAMVRAIKDAVEEG